jgi:hypothetical protein
LEIRAWKWGGELKLRGGLLQSSSISVSLIGPQLATWHPEPIPGHRGVDGAGECGHLCDPVQGESPALGLKQERTGGCSGG